MDEVDAVRAENLLYVQTIVIIVIMQHSRTRTGLHTNPVQTHYSVRKSVILEGV